MLPKIKRFLNLENKVLYEDSENYKRFLANLRGENSEIRTFHYSNSSYQEPFLISNSIEEIVDEIKNENHSPKKRSKKIYDWIQKNIDYSGTLRRRFGYRNSLQTFKKRKGVCGEQAFLYVTMARHAGIKTDFVDVMRDYRGKHVHHHCAVIYDTFGDILVDNTYHLYSAQHRQYRIRPDVEVVSWFAQIK